MNSLVVLRFSMRGIVHLLVGSNESSHTQSLHAVGQFVCFCFVFCVCAIFSNSAMGGLVEILV